MTSQFIWSQLFNFLLPSTISIIIFVFTIFIFIIFLYFTAGGIRHSNGFSPSKNKEIGSFFYFIFHSIIIIICWKIWGIKMFEESIFYMLHLDAFMFVRIFLISIGIWVY